MLAFSHLIPETNYTLYCAAKDLNGGTTSYQQMMSSSKSFKTSCCKRIEVILKQQYFLSDVSTTNALEINFDGSLSSGELTVRGLRRGDIVPVDIFSPNHISLTSPLVTSVRLLNSDPGEYEVVLTQNFVDSHKYQVVFPSYHNFTILPPGDEPPVPTRIQSKYRDDGSILLTFNLPTDRASFTREFQCSLIMRFESSSQSVCVFPDATSLVIYPASSTGTVDGNFSFIEGKVKAACSSVSCESWRSVSSVPFKVTSPLSPVVPVPKIRGPRVVHVCDSPLFDVDLSVGNGGHPWSSLTVTVASSNDNSLQVISGIEDFFSTSYDVNSDPIPVPSGIFRSGKWYLLRFSLCNFLLSCDSADHLVEVINASTPTLVLVNRKQFSQSVSTPLSLEVFGYSVRCDRSILSNGLNLKYEWSVVRDGVEDNSLKSTSKTPTLFKLSPNTLRFGSNYDIKVTVTDTSTGLSSSDHFLISVAPSPLIALITGATRRSLHVDGTILLNASLSHDPDGMSTFSSSTLQLTWSCSRVRPTFSSSCELDLFPGANGLLTISSSPQSVVDSQFNVTLIVSDVSRQSSASVLVDITPSNHPILSISYSHWASNLNHWNSGTDIILFGKVITPVACRASWFLEDSVIRLNGRNQTILSKLLPPGTNTFNLVVRDGSLPFSELPYTMTLAVDGYSSVASLQFSLNSPPRPGNFFATPPDGVALLTIFRLSASQWMDSDLPLTYQFSYQSGGKTLPLRSRSELSYFSTILPVGVARDGGLILLEVLVFDVYNARSRATQSVVVRSEPITITNLSQTFSSALSQAAGNSEMTRQLISVVGSVLNMKNCSGATSCTSLAREDCLLSDNLCGPCLPNHIGNEGDGNSLCIPVDSSSELFLTLRSKECDNDCSHHGHCVFENANSGDSISGDCLVSDVACNAICVCDSGWSGVTCSLSESELQSRSGLRTELMSSLQALIASDDPTPENLLSWTASLSSLSQSSDELSSPTLDILSNISEIILDSSPSASVLLQLFESLDHAFDRSGGSNRRRLQSVVKSLPPPTYSLLTRTSRLLAESLISDESGSEIFQTSFRLSTPVLTSSQPELSVAQTSLERQLNIPTSSCIFTSSSIEDTSAESRVSFLSMRSRYFSDHPLSNPISLQMQTMTAPSFVCILSNNMPLNETRSVSPPPSEYLNVSCLNGDYSVHERQCDGGGSSLVSVAISIACNGTAVRLSRRCPLISSEPGCVSFGEESDFVCTRVGFNSTSTICSCDRKASPSYTQRRLSANFSDGGSRDNVALQLYALNKEVFVQFEVTVLTADNFNVNSVSKSVIVLLMFGLVWID
jgi:hypothetical protein